MDVRLNGQVPVNEAEKMTQVGSLVLNLTEQGFEQVSVELGDSRIAKLQIP